MIDSWHRPEATQQKLLSKFLPDPHHRCQFSGFPLNTVTDGVSILCVFNDSVWQRSEEIVAAYAEARWRDRVCQQFA
jgi:hypothetical protein